MNSSSPKCFDLSRHEWLIGFPPGTDELEGKREYFLSRAEASKNQIEANTFRKIAKLITIALQANAKRMYAKLNYSDPKLPSLYISFEFKKIDEMFEFEHFVRRTEF